MAPIDSPTPPPDGPSRAQIETQLARLLASDAFGGASRSQEFLRFVVEEAMAGRQDRLGGYTLGVEIFGRAEDFDPQTDPIVRVEASRLRRRLEHHYLTEGTEDAVLIEVPKGGYVPEFFHRPVAPEPSSPTVEPQRVDVDPPQRRPSLALVALGLVLLAGLVLSLWWVAQSSLPPRPDEASGQAQTEALTVVVLPFDYTADSDLHPFLADGFVEELVSSLAALSAVEVIAPSSARKVATKELTPSEIGQVLQADHVIRGDVRQERDRIRLTVSVVETSSGIVRLSKTYDERLDNILDLQAEIARDIASSLATEITPTFEHQLTENVTRDSEVLALYHQAAALRDPPSDAVRSRLAEDAYRHIIELDPEFAGGYAGLAYVLAFRSWWGLSEEPATDAQEALEAARMAIEKDPNFAWAQTSLSIASNIVGNYEGSLEAAGRASKLSPGDPYILAFSAMTTAFAG